MTIRQMAAFCPESKRLFNLPPLGMFRPPDSVSNLESYGNEYGVEKIDTNRKEETTLLFEFYTDH